PDDNFLNTNTYAVGDQIITPNTDGDVTTDNVYMRLYDTVVTGKNMGL
ncbi:MAG: hypothetical protein GY729_10355, partial [Desulfobacteraceae bacterium]|nr:hypothetical protein [Desulfobacteraceae bacterium]